MHKKIFFVISVILIHKNIISSSQSHAAASSSSEMTPVVGQIINSNQAIDSRIRRVSLRPTSSQHKENILSSLTRILTEPNSGMIQSLIMPNRKTLYISEKGKVIIEETVIFEYPNPFSRDSQNEMLMSIWETRENNHPQVHEINNLLADSVKRIDDFSSINSILHCLSTGAIDWARDRLIAQTFK